MLDALAAAGCRLGVVTNAYDGKEARARIAHAFPGAHFDSIVVAAECSAPKPDPAPFLRARREVGRTGPAVYVGDLPRYDVPGARAVGLDVVIVTSDATRHAEALRLGARVAPNLEALTVTAA